MQIFTFDYPTPRHSHFASRGIHHDLLMQHETCQPLRGVLDEIEARILYRTGTHAPLGDFPEIDLDDIVVSERALDVFRAAIDTYFEVLPIKVIGGGEIKRSSTWYKKSIDDIPNIPDKENRYFYLHPVRSLQRDHRQPVSLPVLESPDFTNVEFDEDELKKRIEEARKNYKGWLGEIEEDIGDYDVEPIFVVGRIASDARTPVQICLSPSFKEICIKEKLTRLELFEIRNGLNPRTRLTEVT